MGFCPCFTNPPSWQYHRGSVASSATRSNTLGFVDADGNHQGAQELLLRNLFWRPFKWWNNWLDKRSPWHPAFRHKKIRGPLWFRMHSQRLFFKSRVAILDAPPQQSSFLRGQQEYLSLESSTPVYGIGSLSKEQELEEAVNVLFRMDQQGTVPSVETYRALLNACTDRRALAHAKQVHAHLVKHGLESTRDLGEFVVKTLVKCGSLHDALVVFERLAHRAVVSWTAIILGYTRAGRGREALRLYQYMRKEDVNPDRYTFVSLLKACGSIADLEKGKYMHAETVRHGYESDMIVGTTLVDMYAKCGSLVDAQNIFDRLAQQDVVSWNAMLSGYAQQGEGANTLQLYREMVEEGFGANDRTFVSIIQACSSLADKEEICTFDGHGLKVESLQKGKTIHHEAYRKAFWSDTYVGNALIGMYGKCGSIVDAKNVFDSLSQRDVVSWNAMIAAHAQQERGEEALALYGQMLEDGVCPDARSFVSLLQAYSSLVVNEKNCLADGQLLGLESLQCGKAMHAEAQKRGYESNVFVGSTLVHMYAKCGSISDAQIMFDCLSQRNIVSWNAMLAGHTQLGEGAKALQLYQQMQEEDVEANDRTLVSALQACGTLAEKEESALVDGQFLRLESLQMGKAIHAEAKRRGHEGDLFIGSTLISMYAKCGSIVDAQFVFGNLLLRNVVSWNAMLGAYAHQLLDSPAKSLQGLVDVALELYGRMSQQGVRADGWTIVSLLQACGRLAEGEDNVLVDGQLVRVCSLQKVKAIHSEAWSTGYEADMFVGNALVSIYGKCGSVGDAQNVFDGLFERGVVSWNSILAAYAQQGQAEQALQLYSEMLEVGVIPDDRTFVSTLQACGIHAEQEGGVCPDGQSIKFESLLKGRAMHAEAWRTGYGADLFVGNSLITMYGKCGSLLDARNVFESLSERDIVSWNAMLVSYSQQGQVGKVLTLYGQLRAESVSPDDRTFATAVQACGMLAEMEEDDVSDNQMARMECLWKGRAIHAEAWKRGYESNLFIGNSLVSMYGKCGDILDAHHVFDELPQRNVLSWNAIFAAYAEGAQPYKTLQLYEQMQEEGESPNDVTFLCILQACGNIGNLDVCIHTHQYLMSSGNNLSLSVANTLIHAFGRCASMVKAQEVFDALPQPDMVSWNALIAGYARQGKCEASFQCYEKMLQVGIEPDGITFLTLLCACSHAGMVEKGIQYFESMSRDHGFAPEVHHYVSMVDMLGRAGHFGMVEGLLSQMPVKPNRSLWLCLLGACRKHGNIALGRLAFESTIRLDPRHAAAYVLMSNIYAHAGMWVSAQKVSELRQQAGAWKNPGQSWIEHEEEVHAFVVGECRHAQQEQIYDLLGELISSVSSLIDIEQRDTIPRYRAQEDYWGTAC